MWNVLWLLFYTLRPFILGEKGCKCDTTKYMYSCLDNLSIGAHLFSLKTHISVIIKFRDIKFGIKNSEFYALINFIAKLRCRVHRSRKSTIKFTKLMCMRQMKDKSFPPPLTIISIFLSNCNPIWGSYNYICGSEEISLVCSTVALVLSNFTIIFK